MKFTHANTPDTRKPWVIEMERENLQLLEDATTQAPKAESEDLPESEQGRHNIPRLISLGMIDEF